MAGIEEILTVYGSAIGGCLACAFFVQLIFNAIGDD